MDKEFEIIKLYNPKQINMPEIKQTDDVTSMMMNYTETMISQIVKDKERDEMRYVCAEIQKYIEDNGIDICFVMNETELKDCLQNHNMAKLRIEELEHENKILNAYMRHLILTIHNQKEKLENAIAIPKYKIGQEMWRSWSSVRAIREPIDTIHIYKDGQIGYEFADCLDVFMEDELFWTEEEAKKAWEEKQNGKN